MGQVGQTITIKHIICRHLWALLANIHKYSSTFMYIRDSLSNISRSCKPLGTIPPFLFTFIVIYVDNFFAVFEKKGTRPKLTLYKHVSDKPKKCISVVCSLCPRSC